MPLLKHTVGSRTATRAVEEFRTDFQNALVLEEPDLWVATIGLVVTGEFFGPVTFPLPIDAAGYHKFKGEMKYRKLYDRSMSFYTEKWQDGVKELAEKVRMPNFLAWTEQPERMAREWRRMPNKVAAATLEANPLLGLYANPETKAASTRNLFAGDHPFNILQPELGTFDNDRETTVAKIRSGEFYEDASQYYASVMGPNGESLGLTLEGGYVMTNLFRQRLIERSLSDETVINAISNAGVPNATANVVAAVQDKNTWRGKVKPILAKELTSASNNYVYTVASGLPGAYPLVVLQGGTPEEFIHDESSEMYKKELSVAYASVGDVNAGAAMPHTIVRWTITG
jgi:hypothetical protein